MATLTTLERTDIIKNRLEKAFSPSLLEVIDESYQHAGHPGAQTGAGHYAVTIVAQQFEGLSLIKRHQLVYAQLKDLIPDEIHALKINARTTQEISS